MKKLLVLAITLAMSGTASKSFAIDTVTNTLAYTLAQTLYVTALLGATSEATSLAISSKSEQRKEALKLQSEVQDYYQAGEISPYLESKIAVAQRLDNSLSLDDSIDLLLEASKIILNQ